MNDLDQIRAALCASPSDDLPALVRGLVLHAVQTQRRVSGYRQAVSEAFKADPRRAAKIMLRAEVLAEIQNSCKDSTVGCIIDPSREAS